MIIPLVETSTPFGSLSLTTIFCFVAHQVTTTAPSFIARKRKLSIRSKRSDVLLFPVFRHSKLEIFLPARATLMTMIAYFQQVSLQEAVVVVVATMLAFLLPARAATVRVTVVLFGMYLVLPSTNFCEILLCCWND